VSLGPIGLLIALPGRLIGMADDVAKMAAAVQVLPAVLDQLAAIGTRVERLDVEVAEMHAAVESIRGDVVGVEGAVGPLAEQLEKVFSALDPLANEVREMKDAVVPLGPAAERLGTIAGRFGRRSSNGD
jgi:DNA-binding FrmR family transcriptional regulator